MKKILYWILYIVWGGTMILNLVPSLAIADNDCKRGFLSTCYVEGINTIWTDKPQWSALLDSIKVTINRILGILATIAFVICLYAWFKMLTSWADSKWYDAGLKTIKNAAIGLVIIWVSWLIVSLVFWFIGNATWGTQIT